MLYLGSVFILWNLFLCCCFYCTLRRLRVQGVSAAIANAVRADPITDLFD